MSTLLSAPETNLTGVSASLDPEIKLLTPEKDVDGPLVSIVVPALNEQITIAEFVEWCHQGLAQAGVVGEILIIDSSTDQTPEIAVAAGARVLKAPRRGLGRAYIDAIPFIRGRYVIVGDADLTYDFRELAPFIEKLNDGYEFVMGSRWAGTIEKGAMPLHHRYFGSPATTWLLNVFFGSHFSDIHCGMRGLTKDAFIRMQMSSQGWEYASEMILKSLHLKLKTTEVPINFYKDRPGRESHLKRGGWLTPFRAGWDTLRNTFTFGADFFLFRPGLVLATLGLLGMAALTTGPIHLGGVTLTLYTQLFFAVLTVVGITSAYMGILARVANDRVGTEATRWLRLFSYNRSTIIAGMLFLVGLVPVLDFGITFIHQGFNFSGTDSALPHLTTTGLVLIVAGFTTFTFTLLLHAFCKRLSESR